MKNLFCCPVCESNLLREEKSYRCQNGHVFDIAKEGYVNLLPSNKANKIHGDDKAMVSSRTRFLEGGYYEPLKDALCSLVKKTEVSSPVLVDSGCGEGYYTSSLCENATVTVGIDLSKDAIKHASKKCKKAMFAVASAYKLPLENECCDIVVNCFSPMSDREFFRILRPGGYLFYVVPAARHLWELKSILYDTPYENEEKVEMYDGFELCEILPVSTSFTLTNSEDILSLFNMTPYTWKTPRDGIERLKKLDSLSVGAEFRIHVFRKV